MISGNSTERQRLTLLQVLLDLACIEVLHRNMLFSLDRRRLRSRAITTASGLPFPSDPDIARDARHTLLLLSAVAIRRVGAAPRVLVLAVGLS